jgi:catechol-2,3-dioxygenase
MQAQGSARLGHTAISVTNPARVAEFYRDLLDLEIVRQTSNPLIGDAVLLSGDRSEEDHELVLTTNEGARHIAFRVRTLDQLRARYRRARARGLQVPYALDSGVAIGFFVRDPEGNAVEIYMAFPHPRNEKRPLIDVGEIDALILGSDQPSPPAGQRDADG